MRDERLLHLEVQLAEHQGARIGGGRSGCVEIDLLALQVGNGFDLRPGEDVQFRREQVDDVGDALLDVRDERLELLEGIGVDDRGIDPLQVEQGLHVLGRPSGHDRQHMQILAVVDGAGDLRCETDRGSFEQPARQPNGPSVQLFLDGRLSRRGDGRLGRCRGAGLWWGLRRGRRNQKRRYGKRSEDDSE